LPVQPREASLAAIDAAMKRLAARLGAGIAGAKVTVQQRGPSGIVTRLLVDADGVQIKIEVTPVMRGCVYAPTVMGVSAAVEDAFGFAETQVVSFADLYAGKIVAALDRQHPRDLFDVQKLQENEGVSDELRRAFIAYMLSHNRPMNEVLAPNRKDIAKEFESNFVGMTVAPVELDALLATRETIVAEMVGGMPADHREFLLSFKHGKPDWALLGLPEVADLPAVKWRLENLAKAPDREAQTERLRKVLLA
jgi:hypothetical protein